MKVNTSKSVVMKGELAAAGSLFTDCKIIGVIVPKSTPAIIEQHNANPTINPNAGKLYMCHATAPVITAHIIPIRRPILNS